MLRLQLFTFSLLALLFFANAQIKVTPGGDFSIGQNFVTENMFKTEINGELKTSLALKTNQEDDWAWASISDAISSTTKHWIVSAKGYASAHNFWVETAGFANARSYLTISDSSFKTNFRAILEAESLINSLKPYYFDFKPGFNGLATYDSNRYMNQCGFIAQEVQSILPQLVSPLDSSGKLAVNYQAIIPILVKHNQELSARLDYLEALIMHCCETDRTLFNIDKSKSVNEEEEDSLKTIKSNDRSDNESSIHFTISPNPSNGTLRVENNVANSEIAITNLAGQSVTKALIQKLDDTVWHIDMQSEGSGIYYIHLLLSGEVLSSKKFALIR